MPSKSRRNLGPSCCPRTKQIPEWQKNKNKIAKFVTNCKDKKQKQL